MIKHIYADNAATTKLDIEAFEAMKPYLLENYANPSQPYSLGRKMKKAIREAREIIAECIGAEPEDIYFTSGGTESDNWAIKNYCCKNDIKTIITSSIEHHAILNACDSISNEAEIKYLPVDNYGFVKVEDLSNAFIVKDRAVTPFESKLVSIMMANNEIGTVQNVSELSSIAHSNGAIFHTDAVQAVGHIDINVKEMGIDMLSASAHKFNGPKGIGFLYSGNKLMCPFHNGGTQELGMRAGTENVPAIIGMSVALKKCCANMQKNIRKLCELENVFLETLKNTNIDFVRNGADKHLPGLVSVSFRGMSGELLLHRLDLMGICISTGSACDSVNTQVSHVLKAINLKDEYAVGTIRVSFGVNNTTSDAVEVANAIIRVAKENNK